MIKRKLAAIAISAAPLVVLGCAHMPGGSSLGNLFNTKTQSSHEESSSEYESEDIHASVNGETVVDEHEERERHRGKKRRRGYDEDDEDDEPRRSSRRRKYDDDDDDDDDRRRKRRRRRAEYDEEDDEEDRPRRRRKASRKKPRKAKDIGETCHKNDECEARACFVGKGNLGYCTRMCNSFSDCPSFWECKRAGNAPQKICMQDD